MDLLWKDNFDDLLQRFYQDKDSKYAGGGMWFCGKCGSMAKSHEESLRCGHPPIARLKSLPFIIDFDDNGKPIVPVKVRCMQYPICDSLWRLEIAPSCGGGCNPEKEALS